MQKELDPRQLLNINTEDAGGSEQIVSEELIKSIRDYRFDTLSQTVAWMRGETENVYIQDCLDLWGGGNCMMITSKLNKRLHERGVDSEIVMFWPQKGLSTLVDEAHKYVDYDHSAILVNNEYGRVGLLEPGLSVSEPLWFNEPAVEVDGRKFSAIVSESIAPQLLIEYSPDNIQHRLFEVPSLNDAELDNLLRSLLKSRSKLSCSSNDEKGELAALRVYMKEKKVMIRSRGNQSFSFSFADAEQGIDFVDNKYFEMLGLARQDVKDRVMFLVNNHDLWQQLVYPEVLQSDGKVSTGSHRAIKTAEVNENLEKSRNKNICETEDWISLDKTFGGDLKDYTVRLHSTNEHKVKVTQAVFGQGLLTGGIEIPEEELRDQNQTALENAPNWHYGALMAKLKLDWVKENADYDSEEINLACDSIVVVGNTVWNRPKTVEDLNRMRDLLRVERKMTYWGGVAGMLGDTIKMGSSKLEVPIRDFSDEEWEQLIDELGDRVWKFGPANLMVEESRRMLLDPEGELECSIVSQKDEVAEQVFYRVKVADLTSEMITDYQGGIRPFQSGLSGPLLKSIVAELVE